MKVELKDLYNRVYEEKDCTAFDYSVKDEDDTNKQELFEARFRRDGQDHKLWTMLIVLLRSKVSDGQIYSVQYVLPKEQMPLPMVCAIGLKYFQLQLKEEIQLKTNMDFAIGQLTKEM